MPVLNDINIPTAYVADLLRGFEYDPAIHGPTAADKEEFVRSRVIGHLKRIWKRGNLMSYQDAYITPSDPDIT